MTVGTLNYAWKNKQYFSTDLIFQAPAKRSQHLNTTNPNIVGPAFASTGQTIPTFERNISQHCCCARLATLLLRVYACWILKIEQVRMLWRNIVARTWPLSTTSCNIHKCCIKNLTIFKFEPTTPNISHMSQLSGQMRTKCCPKQC